MMLAALAVLLAWNVWLSVRVFKYTTVGTDNRTVIQNTVNGYQTDITELVTDTRASIVSIHQGSRTNSGVIMGSDKDTAYIMTSCQGLSSGQADVDFDNGVSVEGTVSGIDQETGLAFLKVQPGFEVNPVKMSDSSLLKAGEIVTAIGGRRENESSMISSGAVSSMGQMTIGTDTNWICNVLEADVRVSDANVGGALLNLSGELVGIMIAKPSNGQLNFGYAAAMNEVRSIYNEMKNNGSIVRGNLGVIGRSISTMTSYEKSAQGVSLDLTSGVLVTGIQKNSAAEGTLQEEDLIKSIDGKTVMSEVDLHSTLYSHNAGDTIVLSVLRDGNVQSVSVVLK